MLSIFSEAQTFSAALKNLRISQTTLDKHIQILLPEAFLERNGKDYKITNSGIMELDNLKKEIQIIRTSSQQGINPELFRRTMRQSDGNVGKAKYTSFVEAWRSPETAPPEIPRPILDQAVKTLISSVPLKGLGTMKFIFEIRFGNTGREPSKQG